MSIEQRVKKIVAEQLGVNAEFVQNIFEEIFWEARRIQEET